MRPITNGSITLLPRPPRLFFVCTLLLAIAPAKANDEKARLGRVTWTAFQCATFAEMSGNKQEQERLFNLGIKAGQQFLEAVINRKISPEVARSEVPLGVMMLLGGPSADFMLGRIFENAMKDAYDDIVKRQNGMPLPMSDWITDDGLKKSKATTEYLKGNCVLVR